MLVSSLQFYAEEKWLEQFCHLMISRNIKVPWKCVTTVQSLERSDIELMSRAGCFRIDWELKHWKLNPNIFCQERNY